jgi:putative two-component system response regulator
METPFVADAAGRPYRGSGEAAANGADAGRILIVDDTEEAAVVFERMLGPLGYVVESAAGGEPALDAIARREPDVILLDVMMPGMDGFETCRRIKANPRTRLIPVVLVTGLQSRRDRIRGIEVGADDFLAKPPDWPELTARIRSLVRLKRHTDDLDSAESVMLSLALTIEMRDPYTEGHCQRLANYASSLGARLGLPDEDLEALYQGGFLHDLGKIGIPDSVLLKPGPLSDQEFEIVRQHPITGARLCAGLRSLRRVQPIIRHHHERLDGTGYPDGLAGEAIPLLAQIMSIVDIYDALTTPRPYRAALPHEAACEALVNEVGKSWRSKELVREFLAMDTQSPAACRNNDWMLRTRLSLDERCAGDGHAPAGVRGDTERRGLAAGVGIDREVVA